MVSLQYSDRKHPLAKQNTNQLNSSRVPFTGNLSSIEVPVYRLGKPPYDDTYCKEHLFAFGKEQSLLDSLLLAQWEEFAWKGLLRYDVTSCATKVVNGDRKFLAQLNENLNLNLLPEIGNVTTQQLGSFDHPDLRMYRENLLFYVTAGDKDTSELVLSDAEPKHSVMIIINATPVEYGHVFLLPYNLRHPVDFLESLESTIGVAAEVDNCSFRVFYDPPASSNPNHMYFEACYFPNHFPVEDAPLIPIFSGSENGGISIYEVADYPAKALMFSTEKNLRMLIEVVSEICLGLPHQSARFNLLISDCGRKIFLFLQEKMLGNDRNLRAWECGGHFVFNAFNVFDKITEKCLIERMATASLSDEAFQEVKQLCWDVSYKLCHAGQVL